MVVQNTILTQLETAAITSISNTITHVAVGSGTTTPDATQTQLVSEDYREALFTSSSTPNTFTTALYLDVTENNTNTVAEIGAFNSSSGGTMVSRNLTTPATKTSSKEMYFDIKYTVDAINN